ncbi:hypothetical protein LPJ78_001431 [Coemansia sp. RSA 989]|nr:hypothetical protein LPJ68_001305 [Coemansia sp. RSA 1086]KAJ1866894.1 hypothetical protein LPJ78_001431 [Coemansia sp. RSA 989]KAJ1874249.1 hypothetical protein LPJ55_001622 [Coemansia sp. RSA 990]KAJ2651109.1 hypothetical protein IWW40_001877 [Coemansia sp. RSA 1250]KAJ2672946.1 hypothetical protein IWW42_002493 [Coemansia sp. RSA 1085]
MFGSDLDDFINNGGFFIPANMSFNESKELLKTIDGVDSNIIDKYIAIKLFTGEGEVDVSDLKEDALQEIEMSANLSEYEGKHLVAYTDAGEPKVFAIGGRMPEEVLKARL